MLVVYVMCYSLRLGVTHVTPGASQVFVILNVGTGRSTARSDTTALGLFNVVRLVFITGVGVLAALTDPGTELPEQEGDGTASETDKGKESGGPLVVEAVVHLLSEQDHGGTPETSDTSLGCQGGGGLVLVRVDEVVVGGVVQEDEAETNGETTHGGTSPGEVGVRGPGKDEETDGDAPARDHHGDQTGLGGRVAVVLVDEGDVVLVDKGRAESGEDDTDGDGNEHEASLAGGVALALLVDDGEGDKEHVEETVQDTHVDRDEEDDELAKQKLEGSNEEDAETLREGSHVELLLSDVIGLASLLAELSSATGKDGGCVGLGDGKCDEDPDDTGKDELDPVEPAPASGIRKEATNKGTDYGCLLVSVKS